MSSFSDAIDAARGAPGTSQPPTGTGMPAIRPQSNRGPDVQLSVRVPEELRAAVASTANAQGLTVTAFVTASLRRAVEEANDSFAGLAAELARAVRSELRSALREGDYEAAAAEAEREEAWS